MSSSFRLHLLTYLTYINSHVIHIILVIQLFVKSKFYFLLIIVTIHGKFQKIGILVVLALERALRMMVRSPGKITINSFQQFYAHVDSVNC